MTAVKSWPEVALWVLGMWFVVRPVGMAWARSAASGGSAASKARLTEVFEALGAERVARGLEATGHEWQDCFLARALGGDAAGASGRTRARRWGEESGLGRRAIRQLIGAWDGHEDRFRDLAAEWLEETRVPATAGYARPALTKTLSYERSAT